MIPAQRRYLFSLLLFRLGMIVTVTFTNLYLWDLTETLTVILQFNVAVFTGIIFGSLLAGVIGTHLRSSFALFLAALLFSLQLAALHVTQQTVLIYLYEIGLLSGIAIGLFHVAHTSIMQVIADEQTSASWTATSTALTTLLHIVSIPALAYFIKTSGTYTTVFTATIGLFLAAAISSALVRVPRDEERRSFRHPRGVLKIINSGPLRRFIRTQFLQGIQEGLYWAILGIVTLELFGDLLSWGLFAASVHTVTILTILAVARTTITQKKAIDITVAFAFAGATIMLVQNWNLSSFVAYQVAIAVLGVTMIADLGSYLGALMESDEELWTFRHEYNSYGEVVLSLGRLLPVYGLLLANVAVIDATLLKALFLLVAPIPFLVMTMVGRGKTPNAKS